eukprot:COSAG06_NODE_5505_length_3438_cov_12.431156_4_plen_126_part_00
MAGRPAHRATAEAVSGGGGRLESQSAGKCQSSSSAASGHAAAERRRTVNRAPRGGVMARPLSLAKAAGRQAIHSRTARHIVDTIIMKWQKLKSAGRPPRRARPRGGAGARAAGVLQQTQASAAAE